MPCPRTRTAARPSSREAGPAGPGRCLREWKGGRTRTAPGTSDRALPGGQAERPGAADGDPAAAGPRAASGRAVCAADLVPGGSESRCRLSGRPPRAARRPAARHGAAATGVDHHQVAARRLALPHRATGRRVELEPRRSRGASSRSTPTSTRVASDPPQRRTGRRADQERADAHHQQQRHPAGESHRRAHLGIGHRVERALQHLGGPRHPRARPRAAAPAGARASRRRAPSRRRASRRTAPAARPTHGWCASAPWRRAGSRRGSATARPLVARAMSTM